MVTCLALLLLLLILMLLLWWGGVVRRQAQMQKDLPPGPAPLPLLGNLLQLQSGDLDRVLMELSSHWGPVFTVWLGPLPAVVLCGYEALRDALVLQADAFSGRGAMAVFDRFTCGNGIVFSNGPRWHSLRNFALGVLRELGVGRSTIEDRILEEAACVLDEFQATMGAPFDPQQLLDSAVSNVICTVVFGKRYDYGDPEFRRLLNLFSDNFCIMSSRWAEEQQDLESHFQDETLVMTTHDLFFGGTETTSTTLRYGLLIMLKYPEVAAKVQEELDATVGRTWAPRIEDRARLPYTNAVLHEIQRFISVLPLGLPRALTRDVNLKNHFLHKGTFVIPLLVSAHRDPTQFKDPDHFNPTNFLDDHGKRMCLGAGLARSEIFLFLTAILQKFSLLPVGSPANINLNPQCTGLGNVPPAFQLRLVAR